MKRALGVVLLAASCTRQTVVVYPSELANHANEFAQHGSATVYATNSKVARVAATDQIDVMIADGALLRPVHLSIRELVAACAANTGAPGCLANQTDGAPIKIQHGYHFNGPQLATGITFGAIGSALGVCLVACEGAAELRSDLAYAGIGVAVTVGLLLIILAASAGHD